MEYYYELRQAGRIIATGLLMQEHPLNVGDAVVIGSHRGLVAAVLPPIANRPARLTIDLARPA